jgi:hypothetical protein
MVVRHVAEPPERSSARRRRVSASATTPLRVVRRRARAGVGASCSRPLGRATCEVWRIEHAELHGHGEDQGPPSTSTSAPLSRRRLEERLHRPAAPAVTRSPVRAEFESRVCVGRGR